jgi:hypothetical protein
MKILTCARSVGLILLLASPALAAEARPTMAADTANLVERARASFLRGVQLFREESFEAALAEFRKAYQVSPSYRVLYNIAQTYYELHDYVSAQRTLKQYTQDGGNEITPARRIQVEEMNQKLEERIGHLEIVASVDGAEIRVDDIPVGVSPLPSSVLVNAGPRRVSAIKPGYALAVRSITVAGTERARIVLEVPELLPTRPTPEPKISTAQTGPTVIDVEAAATPAQGSRRTAWMATLGVTAGCAVATGVFGALALGAKKDFDNQLNSVSTTNSPEATKGKIDSARSEMKTYAFVTDALGAATLIAGGVALYLVLTDQGEPAKKRGSKTRSAVQLTPTLGGMALYGSW